MNAMVCLLESSPEVNLDSMKGWKDFSKLIAYEWGRLFGTLGLDEDPRNKVGAKYKETWDTQHSCAMIALQSTHFGGLPLDLTKTVPLSQRITRYKGMCLFCVISCFFV